jgi:hypothetical protein
MLRPALLLSALLWACGETAQPSGANEAQGGTGAGMPAGGTGAGGDAGAASASNDAGALSGAGGQATDAGSFVKEPLGGGNGGNAGSAGADSSSAGDPGAAGDASTDDPTRLCTLAAAEGNSPLDQSSLIGSNFRQILAQECRYSGLNCGVDIGAKIDFANGLRAYGPELWHCDGLVAREFRLVYRGRTVTQADAEALIDLYVILSMRKLLLSDSDAARLRKELLTLMPLSLAPDAISISLCDSSGVCPLTGQAGGAVGGGTGGTSAASGGTANQAGVE